MKPLTKVLFLIPSLSSGGIETYLLRFLKMKKSELDVIILIRGNSPGYLLEEYKALDIPLVFMPLGYSNPVRWYRYYNFFERNALDTICDFNANFAGIPMWLAKMANIKNRITFYRQGRDHFKPGLLKQTYNHLMNRMVYKYSTRILSNSIAGIEFFFPYRKAGDSRFKVIYNGIELEQFQIKVNKAELKRNLGIPYSAYVIGHTGRLDKAKNHTTILKVAENLIKKNSNIYLVLCGLGTEKLTNEVTVLGISNNVRLLGYRADIPEILQIFDLFYFPSITEGQPNALIEAMAAGIPIIASNIEPIREIMPFNSKLVDPYDTTNVIAYIEKLIEKPKEAFQINTAEFSTTKFNAYERFNDFLMELL